MSVVSSLSFARVRPRARFQVRAGSVPSEAPPPAKASRRVLFGAALSTLLISPEIVRADEASISASSSVRAVAAQPLGDLAAVAPGAEVYFGNGCFWGRQHEFVQTERTQLGRSDDEVSSLVGYAGGFSAKGKDGKVCYYYGAPDTVYERLGHGEVVRTVLSDTSPTKATEDLRAFAKTYFANFKKIRGFGESTFILSYGQLD